MLFSCRKHIFKISHKPLIFSRISIMSCFTASGNFTAKECILISSSLDFKVMNHNHDNFGRLFCIDNLLNNCPIRFINIYCPNNPLERGMFIKRLDTVLSTSKDIVMGGDFNCVKRDFDIQDPFRVNFPNKVLYTWSGRGIYCRLDRFYISKKLIPYFSNMSTISYPFVGSLHCLYGT